MFEAGDIGLSKNAPQIITSFFKVIEVMNDGEDLRVEYLVSDEGHATGVTDDHRNKKSAKCRKATADELAQFECFGR